MNTRIPPKFHSKYSLNQAAVSRVAKTLERNRVGPMLQRLSGMTNVTNLSPTLLSRLIPMDKGWEAAFLKSIECQVVTDQQATFITSNQAIKELPSDVSLLNAFFSAMAILAYELLGPTPLSQHEFLCHVSATTRITARLAAAMDLQANQVATAAIFHDIGILTLASQSPELYIGVAESLSGTTLTLESFEEENLGTTHTEAGGILLRALQFPDFIVNATTKHHNPFPNLDLVTNLVCIADETAQQFGLNLGLGNASYDNLIIPPGLNLNEDLIFLCGQDAANANTRVTQVLTKIS